MLTNNPNMLADKLEIKRQPGWYQSGCDIEFADQRYTRQSLPCPMRITLANDGFEATALASYEDMVRMRDWLNTAIEAVEAKDAA